MFCIPDPKSADQKKAKRYVILENEIFINDNTSRKASNINII